MTDGVTGTRRRGTDRRPVPGSRFGPRVRGGAGNGMAGPTFKITSPATKGGSQVKVCRRSEPHRVVHCTPTDTHTQTHKQR